MPDLTPRIEAFIALAKKAGYASAQVQISGCVVLLMPKGIERKSAADLFNSVPAMLEVSGISANVRSLPSDNGSAVVVQGLKACDLPKAPAPVPAPVPEPDPAPAPAPKKPAKPAAKNK